MSAELHWFPFFPSDWLASPAVGMMLPEQRGAYIQLLAYAWGDGSGIPSLPDDPAVLAHLSGLGRRWAKLGSAVRAQFVSEDGKLYNSKQLEVWEEQQKKHTQAVVRGQNGARARLDKLKSNSSQSQDGGKQLEPELEPEEAKNVRPTADDERFAAVWALYPRRAGGNSRAAAFRAWKARMADGVDPEAIRAGVERYAAFVRAEGNEGTKFVKLAATFFGPDEHWAEPWTTDATALQIVNGWYAS